MDKALAYARHSPAIHWLTSYSEYVRDLEPWYEKMWALILSPAAPVFTALLTKESELNEIVKLIGSDVLPDDQKLVLEIARVIRLGFLQQNAYHPSDTYVPLQKQLKMMEVILYLYDKCADLIGLSMPMASPSGKPCF